MNNYCVYKHTSPSGKVYIGITGREPEQRWKNGFGYSHQRYLSCAIEKYGWENFKHEILFSHLTLDEACVKEVEMIALYKSNQREFGYNLDGGGIYNTVSDETKCRIRKALTGRKLPIEHRRKISEGLRGRLVSDETRRKIREKNVGRIVSDESRRRMSESHKGLRPSKETIDKWRESNRQLMTPVEQLNIETGETIARFSSTTEALKNTGVDPSSISKCCRGKRSTAGGFRWRYVSATRLS